MESEFEDLPSVEVGDTILRLYDLAREATRRQIVTSLEQIRTGHYSPEELAAAEIAILDETYLPDGEDRELSDEEELELLRRIMKPLLDDIDLQTSDDSYDEEDILAELLSDEDSDELGRGCLALVALSDFKAVTALTDLGMDEASAIEMVLGTRDAEIDHLVTFWQESYREDVLAVNAPSPPSIEDYVRNLGHYLD